MIYTFDDALSFIDRESPESTDEEKILFANTLLEMMDHHNETPERLWLHWDEYLKEMESKGELR